jgi:hypothetical protein
LTAFRKTKEIDSGETIHSPELNAFITVQQQKPEMKITDFAKRKHEGQKITLVTCYDYASARLVREAMQAGAMGFSTSRTWFHRSSDGHLTPGYAAAEKELLTLARELQAANIGANLSGPDAPALCRTHRATGATRNSRAHSGRNHRARSGDCLEPFGAQF